MGSDLPHSAAAIMHELLITEGKATGYDVTVNKRASDKQSLSIAIRDTGAIGTVQFMEGPTSEYPTIQIRVRGKSDDQKGPRTKIVALTEFLEGVKNHLMTIDGTNYRICTITRLSPILPLQEDEKRRWEWTWNGSVSVTLEP